MPSQQRTERSKKLIEALEELGHEPRSYSGRGMFGKTCVSVHDASAWEIAKSLFSERYDGEFDGLDEPSSDALGLGNVLYWPYYPWPDETES